MDCFIRLAQSQDYEGVRKILLQVQALHVEWRPDIYRPNDTLFSREEFEELVQRGTLYVAETDSEVVGMLEIRFRHTASPTQVTRDVVYIETMAVDEAHRGQGVGHLFFEKVKEIRRERNLDGIELQVNARNRAAYAMYAKCGFTEKSINMELLD